ncbi:MAG: multifunctional CCA addition/repair protein [Gammaproteobacteria bacterium]|nr:multifunctional CCA addition/repair protein [Gammaproteobacteria bacterium]
MHIYLVGGAVRDQLLQYPVKEKDWVVVGATPQAMIDQGYTQVGKDFPVFLHPQTHEEYALARTERKTAPGYKGFDIHASPEVTLEEDLLRRDLTINAMAQDNHDHIIDPYNGQADLKNKLLRHVSTAFSEDPVRILRVARFAARYAHLGFHVADETMLLMSQMVNNGEVDALIPERVWQEMHTALSEKNPDVFFQTLKACGALKCIFPELDILFGIPQPEMYHPEIDTGIHTMMVLQQACKLSDDPKVRFAALCHDLGKGKTPKDKWPRHHAHEQLGIPVIKSLCQRLRVPNDFRDLAVITSDMHLHIHRAFELKTETLLNTLEKLDAFRKPARFEEFLLACIADIRGRTTYENCDIPQVDYFRQAQQVISNLDLSEITRQNLSGPDMADTIRQARLTALDAFKQKTKPD